MGNAMHRKSLVKGILNLSRKEEKLPDPLLKEGKKYPIYLKEAKGSLPPRVNKPLKDEDDFYKKVSHVMRIDFIIYFVMHVIIK